MHFPHTPQKNILNNILLSGFVGAAPAGGQPNGCGVCSQPIQETPCGCRAAAPKHEWKPTFLPEEYFSSSFLRNFMVIQKRGEIDSLRNGFWEIQGLTKVYGGGGFQGKKVTIFQTYLMIKSAPHRAAAGTWVVKRALGSPCPVCDTPSMTTYHHVGALGVILDFLMDWAVTGLLNCGKDSSSAQPENHYLHCFRETIHTQGISAETIL